MSLLSNNALSQLFTKSQQPTYLPAWYDFEPKH